MIAARSQSTAIGCIGLFSIGSCFGGGVTSVAKFVCEHYGKRYYSVNYGIATFCMLPASILGPFVSGILQDYSNGSFFSTFIVMLVIDVCAIGILIKLGFVLKRGENLESPQKE